MYFLDDSSSTQTDDTDPMITEFFEACKGDYEKVVDFIEKKQIDIMVKDNYYDESALHEACKHKDNYKIVDYLIKKGVDVNDKDMNFSTPIFMVRSLDILQLLIENKAIINEPDEDNSLPIHKIINRKCGCEMVKLLLDNGSLVNVHSKYDNAPLHMACYQGNKALVDLLLQYKADIMSTDKNGNTPFHIACYNDCNNEEVYRPPEAEKFEPNYEIYDIYDKFIELYKDVNIQNSRGETPLHIACYTFNYELVNKLLPKAQKSCNINDENKEIPLHKVCKFSLFTRNKVTSDKLEIEQYIYNIILLLLEYGSNVNHKNIYNETPLDLACDQNITSVIKLLLEKGATINECKKCPLIIACQKGNDEIIKLLINYGININYQDESGKTALHYACYYNNCSTSSIKFLLDNGANVNEQTYSGKTPLFYVCRGKKFMSGKDDIVNIDTIKLLLQYKADKNIMPKFPSYKSSCINEVTKKFNNSEALKLLVDNADEINITLQTSSDYFRTLFHQLCQVYNEQNKESIEFLISKGGDINKTELSTLRTPLHIACIYNNFHTIQSFIENGADVNKKDCNGLTPIFNLSNKEENYYDCVELLVKNKALINIEVKDERYDEEAHNETLDYDTLFKIHLLRYKKRIILGKSIYESTSLLYQLSEDLLEMLSTYIYY